MSRCIFADYLGIVIIVPRRCRRCCRLQFAHESYLHVGSFRLLIVLHDRKNWQVCILKLPKVHQELLDM